MSRYTFLLNSLNVRGAISFHHNQNKLHQQQLCFVSPICRHRIDLWQPNSFSLCVKAAPTPKRTQESTAPSTSLTQSTHPTQHPMIQPWHQAPSRKYRENLKLSENFEFEDFEDRTPGITSAVSPTERHGVTFMTCQEFQSLLQCLFQTCFASTCVGTFKSLILFTSFCWYKRWGLDGSPGLFR